MTSTLLHIRLQSRIIVFACSVTIFIGGCWKFTDVSNRELSMPVPTTSAAGHMSGLPLVGLRLGKGRLTAEIASTPVQAATGLAFRSTLAPDSAMLFTYQAPHKVVFSMEGTSIPLSIAYIDSTGIILEIHDLPVGDKAPVISGSDAVRFVLETNRGWFDKNRIVPGTRVYIDE